MQLSIILVNFNHSKYLVPCFSSIQNSLEGMGYEVVVVDNHSTDHSGSLIRNQRFKCQLIENPQNMGFARAVNIAFLKTKGEYLLILNPDVQLRSGSVQKMIDFMEQNRKVGVTMPKLLNADGSLQYSVRTFYNFWSLILRRTLMGKMAPQHPAIREHLMMDWDHNHACEVDWGLGAAMMIRRKALSGQKVFDERFFLYFEDVDLCFRMKKEGWKVMYLPEAVLVHSHLRESAAHVFNRAKWEHFMSFIKFFLKHRRFNP